LQRKNSGEKGLSEEKKRKSFDKLYRRGSGKRQMFFGESSAGQQRPEKRGEKREKKGGASGPIGRSQDSKKIQHAKACINLEKKQQAHFEALSSEKGISSTKDATNRRKKKNRKNPMQRQRLKMQIRKKRRQGRTKSIAVGRKTTQNSRVN